MSNCRKDNNYLWKIHLKCNKKMVDFKYFYESSS